MQPHEQHTRIGICIQRLVGSLPTEKPFYAKKGIEQTFPIVLHIANKTAKEVHEVQEKHACLLDNHNIPMEWNVIVCRQEFFREICSTSLFVNVLL